MIFFTSTQALNWSWLREKTDSLGKGQVLGGNIRDFKAWHEKHKSPWQYWYIYSDKPDDIKILS